MVHITTTFILSTSCCSCTSREWRSSAIFLSASFTSSNLHSQTRTLGNVCHHLDNNQLLCSVHRLFITQLCVGQGLWNKLTSISCECRKMWRNYENLCFFFFSFFFYQTCSFSCAV